MHAGLGQRRQLARRRAEEAGGARSAQRVGVAGDEEDGVDAVERERPVREQLRADGRDRPLAVAVDVRDRAARRRLEPLRVDCDAARGQLLDRAMAELVVAEPREEVARAVEPRHLHGHHPAAAGRHGPRVGRVGDVPGLGHLVHEDELDPLDVSDDRASHSATALHVSPMMIAVMAPATIPPFERFYVEHRDEVLGYLRRLLGQRAEDAWQETFLRALRAYDRLEHGRHLRAWVFTIATRVAMDELRSTQGHALPRRRTRRRARGAGARTARLPRARAADRRRCRRPSAPRSCCATATT